MTRNRNQPAVRDRVRDAVEQQQRPRPPATRTVQDLIKAQLPEIERALPKHLDADRFARICTTSIKRVPALARCDATSLLGAVMALAQVGLEPDGRNAHLTPFGSIVTPIIDYRGYMELARRSGQVADIYAHEVYEGDDFHYSFGLHRELHHIPAPAPNRGELTHAYAVVHFKDGGFAFVVLQKEDVEARRERSSSWKHKPKDSPWTTDPAAMWRKSAVRALAPYLPYSPEVARVETIEARADRGERFDFREGSEDWVEAESEELPTEDEPGAEEHRPEEPAQRPKP